MNLILFDDENRGNLLPFTHTRTMADIRCGILTLRKRWELLFQTKASFSLTTDRLSDLFPLQTEEDNYFVNGSVVATEELVREIIQLKIGEQLQDAQGLLLAFRMGSITGSRTTILTLVEKMIIRKSHLTVTAVHHLWHIFQFNAELIKQDFQLLTKDRQSEALPGYVTVIHPENVFVESGAVLSPCIINATEGPVYIGKDAEVMEGCMIRGAFALCEKAVLKMGAKVYGATTIGYYCKVGGEVSNAVFFNYSNKGHDGFIGNAVIGDWCNLGADTNCSNLKNNYDLVSIWHEDSEQFVSTGLQFCGLMMGDHSKCGINTMFNTGTVVGVSCNIFGGGFPPKFIPSFTWGGHEQNQDYRVDKAMETAERMMERRHQPFTEKHKHLFEYLFKQTQKQRTNQY